MSEPKKKVYSITDVTVEIQEDIVVRLFEYEECVLKRTWTTSPSGYKCDGPCVSTALRKLGMTGDYDEFCEAIEEMESAATAAHAKMMLGVESA